MQQDNKIESLESYLKRFNEWFAKANARITEGYETASAAVELEDGGEWGCDWEMDAKAINADARNAIQNTDLLHSSLQGRWLAILDSADQANSVYSIGTLMHMGKFAVNCFGEKTSTFYLQSSKEGAGPRQDEIEAIWYPETICSGMAVTGKIAVQLRQENGKLTMATTEYRPD